MITAKEARKSSNDNNTAKIKSELEEIDKAIHSAIQKGEFKINYYKPLSIQSTQVLYDNGYNLKPIPDQRDGDFIIISWE